MIELLLSYIQANYNILTVILDHTNFHKEL